MMEFVFWLRLFNVAMAIFVAALCFMKLVWNDTDKARRARIVSLGLLTASIALGSIELLREPFSFRVPIASVALVFAAYGMKNMSTQPETFKGRLDNSP